MIEATLFVVAVLVAVYVLAPAFRRTAVPVADARATLEAAQAAALRALHDLELDWATGKLSDHDYRVQRVTLEAEAAAILRQLGTTEPTP